MATRPLQLSQAIHSTTFARDGCSLFNEAIDLVGKRSKMVAARWDAVVFDLDGTLVDTAPDLHAHLNEMLADLGRPGFALADVRPMIGDGARMLLWRGLDASGGMPEGVDIETLFAEFLRRYTARPLRFGAAFDGVEDALRALGAGGTKLGVCTNKPQAPTDRLLAELDLARHFPVVIGGDSLPVRKPDPGHLLAVLKRLGAAPEEAVLVGDSENDVRAAAATGMPCVLVSFGYTQTPARALGAARVIDHMSELAAALDSLPRA
jgi:phosphoglycolate phosphatase